MVLIPLATIEFPADLYMMRAIKKILYGGMYSYRGQFWLLNPLCCFDVYSIRGNLYRTNVPGPNKGIRRCYLAYRNLHITQTESYGQFCKFGRFMRDVYMDCMHIVHGRIIFACQSYLR